ncbi:hypothetical protein [Paraburkholderia panacisoli]|jgi:hypothetical protein|uniref:hypothetical protein n=1 Tax=Paraburkholderia panacisoli TaxID=2603818 RepID=UPI001FE7F36B|nr:hypothetical protein [Paraburkholderia panacisoli]
MPLRDRCVGPASAPGLKGWIGAYQPIEIDAGHRVVLREPERFVAGHREDSSNGQRMRGKRVNKVG